MRGSIGWNLGCRLGRLGMDFLGIFGSLCRGLGGLWFLRCRCRSHCLFRMLGISLRCRGSWGGLVEDYWQYYCSYEWWIWNFLCRGGLEYIDLYLDLGFGVSYGDWWWLLWDVLIYIPFVEKSRWFEGRCFWIKELCATFWRKTCTILNKKRFEWRRLKVYLISHFISNFSWKKQRSPEREICMVSH